MKSPTRFTAVAHASCRGAAIRFTQKALGTKLSGSGGGGACGGGPIDLDQILSRAESGIVPTRTIFAFDLQVSVARLASPKHSGRWHWITWRGLQARSNNRRSDFPDKFVTHPALGKNECRCRQTALNPILNARERRESAISSADQLR